MDEKRPHGKDLRKGRFSEADRVYHITTATRQRMPVFADFPAARTLIQVLRGYECCGDANTLAFVVMPDHVHWLMQLGSELELSRIVGDMKSITAHCLGMNIWQSGFHDHALRKEEDVIGVARYIVANPLRAGLVRSLKDYPHWDSVWL
jgi:REP element-mobilizing transposase RayT